VVYIKTAEDEYRWGRRVIPCHDHFAKHCHKTGHEGRNGGITEPWKGVPATSY
jgi:hypothetical protein